MKGEHAPEMNDLPEKCDEAGLNEVLIVGKRFSETPFPHDLEVETSIALACNRSLGFSSASQ
jgi:hypothetical protein